MHVPVQDVVERERALQESEERFRATFEQAAVGVAHTTTEGRFLQVNTKLCQMLGYDAVSLLELTTRDLTHPDDRDKQDALRQELLGGRRISFAAEKRYVCRDGAEIWVNRTVTLARRSSTGERYLIQVIEDISERKRTEARLARLTRARRVMAACNHVLVHADDERPMLESMCHIVAESGGYKMAWVGYPADDDERGIRAAAHAGFGNDVPMSASIAWGADGRYQGFMREVIATGKPHVARDILNDPSLKRRRDRALQHGFQSSIALPLEHGSAILGAIAIYAREADAFDDEEIALLTELASDIAYGIVNLRTRIAREQAEERSRETERRFRETFEQAAVGLTRVDLNGVLVDFNQKFCDMLGYTRAELMGKAIKDITHLDDYGQGSQYRAQLVDGAAKSRAGEKRFLRKDGSVLWARRTMSTACDAAGKPQYVISVVEDITERKESDERYRATFDGAPVGIMHVDLNRKIMQVNSRVCEILGYAREELIGKQMDDLVHPEFRTDRHRYTADMLSGKRQVFSSERLYLRKDGSTIWVNRTLSLVRDAAGQPLYYVRVIEDISERKAAEERYRATFDNAPVGILHTSIEDDRILHVNSRMCELMGYTHEELVGMTTDQILHPDFVGGDRPKYREKMLNGELGLYASERAYRRKDGSDLWINRTVSLARDASGKPLHFIRIIEDIGERKRAEAALKESEQQFRQLSGNIPQVFWITDTSHRETLYISPAAEAMLGRPIKEVLADRRALIRAVHKEDRVRVYAARKAAVEKGYDETYRIVRPDGSIRWVHDRAFPVHDASGNVYRIAGIAEDVTDRKLAEERLMQLAHYDVLTSLPNRVLFYDRLRQALAQARRNQWITGVMFMDVDRFKNINDTLGHAVGDRLLQQASERLKAAVRSGDTVGRLGGDEFAIVLSNLGSAQNAKLVAQKILAGFNEPFRLEGAEIFVTTSIGITLYPDDSTDQDTLIKNADAAMYRAKDAGRNGYQFYTREMGERSIALLNLEGGLRRALERDEFLLYYQPKAGVATGDITGFEALLRWRHPERGLVMPDEFIPVLEETGLIVPVGEWVLNAVCGQLNEWTRTGLQVVPVAINLSARQFLARDLGPTIQRILDAHRIDPALIELEITESSLMVNPEEATRTLEYLKTLGVRISIDDFGTGYSSLGYLKRFPLDSLKVDRSFVRDVTTDADDATITRAVITMAHSLGLKVIAEGVETESQLAFLVENGCDQIQGFYLARPQPAAECVRVLSNRNRAAPAAADPELKKA